MKRIDTFLELVVHQGGSDLHLIAGIPPRIRLYGDIYPVKYRALSADETLSLIEETMTPALCEQFATRYNLDYAYEIPALSRFRVNVFRHLHGLGAVFRVIPGTVHTLEELEIPPVVKTFCREKKGLVLVTGPTGSGKSTTLAAMIDFINQHRQGHIITIEDPVEYVHSPKGCLVSHREVGLHTPRFQVALHSALREDPDVILVGELRDHETINLALTASETGILVLGTLHTNGAAATIDRIINVFPAGDQLRIRAMLSTSLCGIISQQLLRRADGKGRLAVCEILINNTATANIIREGKTEQIANVIQSGALVGMQSFDNALRALVDAQLLTGEDAYKQAVNKKDFEHLLAREA